jgi:transposase
MGIDQHRQHLTICLRNAQGQVIWQRQVKTLWPQVAAFLAEMDRRSVPAGGYAAVMEVCGFNDWLVRRLQQHTCRRVYVVKAPDRVRQKTDRRDAAKLSELLWLNRDRIASGLSLLHIKEVHDPGPQAGEDRQLVHLRLRLGQSLTRLKNRIKYLLRKHNLEQECPTQELFCQRGHRWLKTIPLPELDALELNLWLEQYDLHVLQIQQVSQQIDQRAEHHPTVGLLRTLGKMGSYTALALAAHIGSIERFPTARSLSNYFGIVPSCRNSGQKDHPGSITKAGHPVVRFLLGQLILHALRADPGLRHWYRQIKRRRGAKIARVAVMRRLCESIWHMLKKKEPYQLVKQPSAAQQSAA